MPTVKSFTSDYPQQTLQNKIGDTVEMVYQCNRREGEGLTTNECE